MRGVLYSRKDRPREYCKNKTLANNSMVLLRVFFSHHVFFRIRSLTYYVTNNIRETIVLTNIAKIKSLLIKDSLQY